MKRMTQSQWNFITKLSCVEPQLLTLIITQCIIISETAKPLYTLVDIILTVGPH